MFGVQVMKGVIEEKTNRIIEIVVSSVKPFELLMGKIIGIAMVGLTQFVGWVMISMVLMFTIFSIYFPNQYNAATQADIESQELVSQNNQDQISSNIIEFSEVSDFLLNDINWVLMIGLFIFYFLGGYLLYGGLMAAIGSAVDNETDTQQFMLPMSLPLVFAIAISQVVITNPMSNIAFWLSEIPFTSPIIMLVRVAMGVGDGGIPVWELVLSMFLLIATFILTTYIASKIYRIGILMYGKKASYKEIIKWLRYK
jgi:ABC-2 type transport system permease protein